MIEKQNKEKGLAKEFKGQTMVESKKIRKLKFEKLVKFRGEKFRDSIEINLHLPSFSKIFC